MFMKADYKVTLVTLCFYSLANARNNLLLDRQRRFTFQQALKQLQTTSDDVDCGSEPEVISSSECESIRDTDKLPLEEEICDIDVYEKESEDEETSSDVDQETDGGSPENEI